MGRRVSYWTHQADIIVHSGIVLMLRVRIYILSHHGHALEQLIVCVIYVIECRPKCHSITSGKRGRSTIYTIRKITVMCNLYYSNVSPRERSFLSWQTPQLAFSIRTNLRPHRPKCKEVCSTSRTKIERPTSGLTNINRLKDDRWTSRVTTWRPYDKKRRQGRPAKRWRDDLDKYRSDTICRGQHKIG